ncbi:MAG: sigma-70 family RNA polymerase sigma factor [Planctomycetota bacterium]|jgi:RNA polymerase sigma-70 factor (ECF subfamily)
MSKDEKRTTEGLAREALGQDPEAFAALVQRLRGRLEMWISLRMGPLLRARLTEEDVLQETLLHAHRSLPDFRDQGQGSFRRWMFSVAENRLRDLHKYHAAQKRDAAREAQIGPRSPAESQLLQSLSASGTSPSSAAHRRDLVSSLAESIARLPEPLRDVLVLRAIEERTFKEIAQQLEKPPATVKGLYVRALKSLRDELKP